MELVKHFFVSDLWSVLHGKLFCCSNDIFVFTRDKSNIIGDITFNGLAVYSHIFFYLVSGKSDIMRMMMGMIIF